MSKPNCPHCSLGFLGNAYGADVECVNGVLIDIDVATEGWQPNVAYPPAPCHACLGCGGTGDDNSGECRQCNSTGWASGRNESQKRLSEWASA